MSLSIYLPTIYGQFSLFVGIMYYNVTTNTKLTDTEPGEIQG